MYYSTIITNDIIEIAGDEYHHLKDVMRHKIDDEIYVTDGNGVIYHSKIKMIEKNKLECKIFSSIKTENKLKGITFCIPRMKSADRFEFALEKTVELGITNFIVFDSKRTVAKGEKLDRWQKIVMAAMKQSLRAWLPSIRYVKHIESLFSFDGGIILFDQNANDNFTNFISSNNQSLITNNWFFIFGPEGGFEKEELKIKNELYQIKLTENRLRSETAIITAASILAVQV